MIEEEGMGVPQNKDATDFQLSILSLVTASQLDIYIRLISKALKFIF